MAECTSCGAGLESPLVCAACDALQSPDPEPGPFEALGLEPGFGVEPGELRKGLLRLSRRLHPDYFGTADPELRALAERNSAILNTSYEILADPFRRADWLVRADGGPSEKEERQMPRAFLLEVLEWNEAVEEAKASTPGSAERASLTQLETSLREHREETMRSVARLLEPLPERGAPALSEARRQLNAIRYLDRTLGELEALRLEEASTG